jgi:hypothetical protein
MGGVMEGVEVMEETPARDVSSIFFCLKSSGKRRFCTVAGGLLTGLGLYQFSTLLTFKSQLTVSADFYVQRMVM